MSVQDAASQYHGAEPLLSEAWKLFIKQTASVVGDAEPPCTGYPAEQFSDKLGRADQIVLTGEKSV